MWAAFTTFITSGLIAGGHLLSWNAEFPRTRAQILWRVCSVYALFGPWSAFPSMVGYLVGFAMVKGLWPKKGVSAKIRDFLLKLILVAVGSFWVFMLLMYAAARVLLLLLVIYSFYSLPEDVYETPRAGWLGFIPFFH